MLLRIGTLLLVVVCVACGGGTTIDSGSNATQSSSTQGSGGQTGSGGSGGNCSGCMSGFICCNGECVNPNNDIGNCGDCGVACPGASPYCDNGNCGTPPCAPNVDCGPDSTCCDSQCCMAGYICCTIPGPIGSTTECIDPMQTGGTCPPGCTECKCASPETPIATPDGERPIATLATGDRIYSVEGDAIVAVPILLVTRTPVEADHEMLEIELASGALLRMSPGHPTADGRTFAALRPGDRLDGTTITRVRAVPYVFSATYDILPASSTRVYFAAGVAVGSTLAPPRMK